MNKLKEYLNKLKYIKVADSVISIDLGNHYTVIVLKTWNIEKQNYTIQLMLKENSVDKWDLIEEAETIEINTNHKFINSAILKQIDLYLSEGFFDKYIDRYEYELKCFDRGNDLFESESMSQCNVK